MTEAAGGDEGRGGALLALARVALEETFGEPPRPVAEVEWLQRPGASFVTLKLDGQLQGCIGSLEPRRSLAEDVRANARAAAFEDPRFPALTAEQLPRVRIEVALLSELEPVEWRDEEELLSRLRPGVDGLVLEHGLNRGTFLPAVWRQLPGRQEFLRHLKRKAGLDPEFWAPDVRISRYTVASWAEPV